MQEGGGMKFNHPKESIRGIYGDRPRETLAVNGDRPRETLVK
jgi:hypothetical protein